MPISSFLLIWTARHLCYLLQDAHLVRCSRKIESSQRYFNLIKSKTCLFFRVLNWPYLAHRVIFRKSVPVCDLHNQCFLGCFCQWNLWLKRSKIWICFRILLYLKSESLIEDWVLFIFHHFSLCWFLVSRLEEYADHRVGLAPHQVSLLQVQTLDNSQHQGLGGLLIVNLVIQYRCCGVLASFSFFIRARTILPCPTFGPVFSLVRGPDTIIENDNIII